MKKRINLPMQFSIQSSFDEGRFLKVRLKVMHNGLNRNYSNFNDEVIENAMPTISNIPILAFVKKQDGSDESDYGAHEFEIKIVKDDLRFIYLGRPIGIIPETNNYTYEEDESGKKFVYVDGYIWKNYANEALDIITRDEEKKLSMEIEVQDYDFESDYMNIKKYSYNGVALLGDDVPEGMLGAKAKVELEYSKTCISEMLFELKEALKGGEQVEINKTKDFEAEENKDEKNTETPENENQEPAGEGNNDFQETGSNDKATADPEGTSDKEEEEFTKKTEDETVAQLNEKIKELEEANHTLTQESESMKSELVRLKKFESDTIEQAKTEAIEAIFGRFTELSKLKEFTQLKEKANSMKLSDLETQLYALKGKYGFFSNKNEGDNKDEEKDYVKLIAQYDHKITDEPEWAELVKNYKEE